MKIPLCAALFCAVAVPAGAQTCTFSIGGLNRARAVLGPVHAECPGSIHTAPFGNWGASSNFGSKRNGHQFDGWCHNSYTCDNSGHCRYDCTEGWYEWNSCTDIPQYQPPNCSLYNYAACTLQVTTTDTNVLGTIYASTRVSCPYDTNGDGYCDAGGCKDVGSITLSSAYMSLYELDPVCCDDLVQSVYFPPTSIPLACTPWRCPAAGSAWVPPSFYYSPSSPGKVWSLFAMAANYGTFSDSSNACAAYARIDPKYNCR